MSDKLQGTIFHVPLDLAQTPKNGECLVNKWWAVHPEKGVAFYTRRSRYYSHDEEPSPQCNSSEHVAKRITKKLHPGHEDRQIEVVYMAHAIKEMRRIIQARARAALAEKELRDE